MSIRYEHLTPEHFNAVVALGNYVHGDNYIDLAGLQSIYDNSWADKINASWVAIDTTVSANERSSNRHVNSGYLVGFRLTLAAQNWRPDEWCSPQLWPVKPQEVCYFKCNTVDDTRRQQGIGKNLLHRSINSAKAQGAQAGLAHVWLASPNNSAFGYFSACGGKLVKEHPNKWQIHSIEDAYECPVCKQVCTCTAAEMLLHFDDLV